MKHVEDLILKINYDSFISLNFLIEIAFKKHSWCAFYMFQLLIQR